MNIFIKHPHLERLMCTEPKQALNWEQTIGYNTAKREQYATLSENRTSVATIKALVSACVNSLEYDEEEDNVQSVIRVLENVVLKNLDQLITGLRA